MKKKTHVWSRKDAKTLLDSIPRDSVSGLRDVALIASMLYSFAREGAMLKFVRVAGQPDLQGSASKMHYRFVSKTQTTKCSKWERIDMHSTGSDREDFSRRKFLTGMTRGLLASAVVATNAGAVTPTPAQDTTVPIDDEQLKRNLKLAPLYASSEQSADAPPLPYTPQHRVGIAVVGLGHLSLGQILPAFAAAKRVRLAGLVSGDPTKAAAVATLCGVPAKSVYNYQNYESMRENPDIDAVYVVLPNALHAEYTIRAAQAAKHVLCEKPMAVSSQECEQMIAACKIADRKLMIAYRIQYEPYNRIVQSYVRSEKFGRVSLIEQ